MPRIRLITAVRMSMSSRFPPERNSTRSVMTRPMPVSVTVPTTMPAAAVATPIPIMLRAPPTRLSKRSFTPWAAAGTTPPEPRKKDRIGRWVRRMTIMNTVAQNAESPGL